MPQGLIPFEIDTDMAKSLFRSWIRKKWFVSPKLKRELKVRKFHSVYVPFWTFDADFYCEYVAHRGYFRGDAPKGDIRFGDKTLGQMTRQVDWELVSGELEAKHNDIYVVAAKGLPEFYIDRLEPWDLSKLQAFQNEYVSGYHIQKYQIDLEQGFKKAKEKGKDRVKLLIYGEVGGDTQKLGSMEIRYSNIQFRHILLPLFVCSYSFKEVYYQFVVNGQTKEVQGKAPKSALQIILFVSVIVMAVIIFVGFVYFSNMQL